MTFPLLNPTAQATLNTLRSKFNFNLVPGKAALKKTESALGDLTAKIEIVNGSFHGSLAIAFTEQTILSFTQQLVNETYLTINTTVKDAACDLATIIGSGVKQHFAQLGVTIDLKHPSVTVGYNQNIVHPLPGTKIVFPFNSEDGIIFLETCFHCFKENPFPSAEAA